VIEGAVITFNKITEQKRTQAQLREVSQALERERDYAESIINTVREPLIVLDAELRAVSANQSFFECFDLSPEETVGRLLYDLGDRQWDIPELRKLLEEILPESVSFRDFRMKYGSKRSGQRAMLLNAREVRQAESKDRLILLALEDITEQ
jgi:PAS domain S-box-containing protein